MITATGSGRGRGQSIAGRAMPGAIVPEFRLVDQDGETFMLRDLAGKAVVMTFIYTRCPLPDFCPLMVKHLEGVRRHANEAGIGDRVALLGVTLDPSFDTPAVLRTYGESVLKGRDRFDQWTLATGTADQIEAVAQFFGVGYRGENGLVTHTLTTAVVGHEGRVMRVFESNAWHPDELFDVARRVVERAAASTGVTAKGR
jgi:protein SCO1/2